jgi:hypothetical protein
LQKLDKIIEQAQNDFVELPSVYIVERALGLQTIKEYQSVAKAFVGKQYMDCMQQLIQASDLPIAQRQEKIRAIASQYDDSPLVPGAAFVRASELYDSIRAMLDYAQAAVAVERYRLKHNKLPDSLEVLLGDYLEAVPLDMTTLKPAGYIAEPPKSFQIYNFGKDGIDDKAKNDDRVLIIRTPIETPPQKNNATRSYDSCS